MQRDGLALGGSIGGRHGGIDDMTDKGYANLYPEDGPYVDVGDGF
jgi:hypothetical protein